MEITFASHDHWGKMVPEPIRTRFATLTDSVSYLEEHPESQEAVLSLWWKVYDLSEKELLSSLEMLEREVTPCVDGLERKLNQDLHDQLKRGGGNVSRFFVYLHLAASLLAMLETRGERDSERYVEILNEVIGFWNAFRSQLPQPPQVLEITGEDLVTQLEQILGTERYWPPVDDPFSRSFYSVAAILRVKLFELRDAEGKWQEALSQLKDAIELSERAKTYYGTFDFEPGAPVRVFEKLWDNQKSVETWRELVDFCRAISCLDNVADAELEWKGEVMQGLSFWTYAAGLCEAQFTPTDLIKYKALEDKDNAKKRLKHYFFSDCWENLPEEIREQLSNIDHIWLDENRKDFGDILENLKIMAEELLQGFLWDPFVQWRSSRQVNVTAASLKRETHFDDLLKELGEKDHKPGLSHLRGMLELPTFRRFVERSPLSEENRRFILDSIGKFLAELNLLRNKRAHRKPYHLSLREEVAPLLNMFFGVGQPGVLPTLARITKGKRDASLP